MGIALTVRRRLGRAKTQLRKAFVSVAAKHRINAMLGRGVWTLDRAGVTGQGVLDVAGWVAAPDAGRMCLSVDGKPAMVLDQPINRPDLAAVFPYLDRDVYGFDLALPGLSLGDSIELDIVSAADHRPLGPHRSRFMPARPADLSPLPEPARMRRVHGSADERSFRLVGYSTARRLDAILRQYAGRTLSSPSSVLDWGCGCGRLLRHLPADRGVQVTGADIDADNLDWCRTNLPSARYVHLPLLPPAPLEGNQFDAIVGISVFTHLAQEAQWRWLEELERLARPGGMVLVTIHGPTAQAMSGDAWLCDLIDRLGFADARSEDLDDVMPETTYYRTAYHSHDYIRQKWSRVFDVLDIVPASVAGVHDLVVLRKRGG